MTPRNQASDQERPFRDSAESALRPDLVGTKSLLTSLGLGIVAGMRSMVPLAGVSHAARRGHLPRGNGASAFLSHPLMQVSSLLLAVGELAGDKWSRAPDRIVAAGMAARVSTGALSGAAVARREERAIAALIGATAAVGSAYLSFHLRQKAMRRFGQVPTGVIEDVLAVGTTLWLSRRRARLTAAR